MYVLSIQACIISQEINYWKLDFNRSNRFVNFIFLPNYPVLWNVVPEEDGDEGEGLTHSLAYELATGLLEWLKKDTTILYLLFLLLPQWCTHLVQLDIHECINLVIFRFFIVDLSCCHQLSHFGKPSSLTIEFTSHRVVQAVLQFRCNLFQLLFLVVSFL